MAEIEPSWLTFTALTSAGTLLTRFILSRADLIGLPSRIPERIDDGLMIGLALLAVGLSLAKPLNNQYRSYALFSGLMMGVGIGFAFEDPVIGLPLGITALGIFTIGLGAENMLPK